MAKLRKLRRGTTLEHSTFIGAEGELTYDTDTKTLVLHDGVTAGGYRGLAIDTYTRLEIDALLAGMVIDAYTQAEIDALFAGLPAVDAYTVAQTDSLLAGKLGTAATAANSSKLGGSTLAQVIAAVPTYSTDREWKYITPGQVGDGYAQYGVADFISVPILPSAPGGGYKNMEFECGIANERATTTTLNIGICDYGVWNAWVGTQPIGTNLTLGPSFSFQAFGSSSEPGVKVTWDTGAVVGRRVTHYKHTLTAAKVDATGDANGYGVRLMLYSALDPKLNIGTNTRLHLVYFRYRFV